MSLKTVTLLLRSQVSFTVLAKYWAGRARRMSRRALTNEYRAARVAEVRREFEQHAREGKFSNTWFDGSIELWLELLAPLKSAGRPVELLEVGSWEGRSSLFLLSFLREARLTAVDTWEGGTEHQQDAGLATLEQRFDHNVAAFKDRLEKRKGLSSVVLSQLAAERPESYDFIFVDGSHFADDVMVDAVLAWRLLREGGVLVFDDYLWRYERYGWTRNPAPAINLFLRMVKGDYALLHVGHQLAVRKTASLKRFLS